MICQQCRNVVQENALYCPICKRKLRFSLPTTELPNYDMYGNEIFIFQPDVRKQRLRNNYVWKLKEQTEARNIHSLHNSQKSSNVLFSVLIGFGTLMLISFLGGLGMEPALGFFLFIAAVTGIIALNIIRKPVHNNKYVTEKKKIAEIHESKRKYYTSQTAIGYCVLDHVSKNDDGPDTYYYAQYEVDKNSIVSIAYDSYYAEYVLYLNKPVYMDFALPPQKEFRIADIFDDQILSKALGCDLPPKHMNF